MTTAPGKRQTPVRGGRPREVRVKLTEAEHEALLAKATAERVTIAHLLVQSLLTPQDRSVRALVFELLSFRMQLQTITNSLVLLALDGETEGYDVEAHDMAVYEVARLMRRVSAAIDGVAAVPSEG